MPERLAAQARADRNQQNGASRQRVAGPYPPSWQAVAFHALCNPCAKCESNGETYHARSTLPVDSMQFGTPARPGRRDFVVR